MKALPGISMRGRRLTRLVIAAGAAVASSSISAISETTSPPAGKGCPLEIAVQQVDQFVQNRFAEYSRATIPLLEEIQAISNKATKPGIPVGQQLSAKDRDRFNQLRHTNIQIGVEELKVSNFQRDVHLIAETYKVAQLADLYEVRKDNLGDADPRRFYFTVLESLRIAQPRTSRTPLINVGIDCSPEIGLYFEGKLYQRQLAEFGADQRLVNLIFDMERLRTLYQLSWNMFDKGINDVRAMTWAGDTPNAPDTIGPMIATSSAATQNMYRAIVPYIDRQLPSEKALEAAFLGKVRQQAERDYPVQQK
jgi:hypothetical protein